MLVMVTNTNGLRYPGLRVTRDRLRPDLPKQ